MNEQLTKQFETFADMMKTAMPQVKANKNGYEIRTKVLEMAQGNVYGMTIMQSSQDGNKQ